MSARLLSIVTAIKDGLSFFRQTAPTILNQTHKNWEWIIVDDGSTEPIREYIASLNEPRIRYLRNETSQRQTRCLNRAIRESRSDWIIRMDGDDLAAPTRLSEICLAIPAVAVEAPLIFSDYDVIHEDGSPVARVLYKPGVAASFYEYLRTKNNPLCHPTVAFYKYSPQGTVYQFDENLRNAQDYELWKRIYSDYGPRFRHVAHPLIQYRLVRQSLSGANIREQQSELEAIRRNFAGSTEQPGPALSLLSAHQRDGMYAFRVLYYRFLGTPASEGFESLHWVAQALRYPKIWPKAMFFASARVLRAPLKRKLFGGIFI